MNTIPAFLALPAVTGPVGHALGGPWAVRPALAPTRRAVVINMALEPDSLDHP